MQNRQLQVQKTHCLEALCHYRNPAYRQEILNYTLKALEKDLHPDGDITTKSCLDGKKKVKAKLVSKSKGILAGMQELQFLLLDPSLEQLRKKLFSVIAFQPLKKDGDRLKKNDCIALLEGKIEDILKMERTILNLLQRMSGVATFTAQFVQQIKLPLLITPTRKTVWGYLDKRACIVGGGGTHRFNLSDAILVKDTHLDLLNRNFEKLFKKLCGASLKGRFIEIEVEDQGEALKVAELTQRYAAFLKTPLYLMFDNMEPKVIKKTLLLLKKRQLYDNLYFEASGGINLENVNFYAQSGVDILSIGALTHSVHALDISLKIY